MDVIAYCNDGTEYLIDVSARNPLANRYRQGASTQPGFACGRGEDDKQRKYPVRRGKQVIPCIVESFGKIGERFLDFMDQAGVHAIVSGAHGSSQPRHIKGKWLTDISAVINKCVARCYKSAACGSQGRRTALEGLLRPPDPGPQLDPSLLLPPPPHISTAHNLRSVVPTLSLHPGLSSGVAAQCAPPISAFPSGALASTPLFPPSPPSSPPSPHSQATFSPCSQRTDIGSLAFAVSASPPANLPLSTQLTCTPFSQNNSFTQLHLDAAPSPTAAQTFSFSRPAMSFSNAPVPPPPPLPPVFPPWGSASSTVHPLRSAHTAFDDSLTAAAAVVPGSHLPAFPKVYRPLLPSSTNCGASVPCACPVSHSVVLPHSYLGVPQSSTCISIHSNCLFAGPAHSSASHHRPAVQRLSAPLTRDDSNVPGFGVTSDLLSAALRTAAGGDDDAVLSASATHDDAAAPLTSAHRAASSFKMATLQSGSALHSDGAALITFVSPRSCSSNEATSTYFSDNDAPT